MFGRTASVRALECMGQGVEPQGCIIARNHRITQMPQRLDRILYFVRGRSLFYHTVSVRDGLMHGASRRFTALLDRQNGLAATRRAANAARSTFGREARPQ